FRRLDSAVTVRDTKGRLLHDRFVLTDDGALDAAALGATEGRPYFASMTVIAAGAEAFRRAVATRFAVDRDVVIAAGALPRCGAIVRCLAASSPVLLDAIDVLWAIARRELLGLPPLALRKP